MALATKIALYLSFIAFFLGQLYRPKFLNFTFPIFDLAILLLFTINLIKRRKEIKFLSPTVFFIVFSLFSLLINYFRYPFSPSSVFYWLRLSSLLFLLLTPPKIDNKIEKFFGLVLLANLIFGFIQYLFWPDFTYFSTFNWDPHLYRLLSTFLDPTFTGLIFLMFLLKSYFSKKNYLYLFLIYLGLALTYSRSSLLCFFIVFSFISLKKKRISIFLTVLIISLATIFLLPRMPGEGTKLERTSSIKAKIVNYQQAIKQFSQASIIGVGYNNLPTIRPDKESHANSGFDSSLLTIATTTGLIGLCFFILIFTQSLKKSSLYWQSLILAIFIHSLFANSLLYPWTLFFLVIESKYRK